MCCFIFCNIAATYYTQKWAYADPEEQQDKLTFYVIVIFAFTVGMGIFIFFRVTLFIIPQLKVSSVLHNRLIKRVFQAPINLFYDVTPIGKILNRFSKDLAIIDEQVFFDFGTFLA